MKRFLSVIFIVCFAAGSLKAQSGTIDSKYGIDSLKTLQMASICAQYCNEKNYTDALNSWRYLFLNAPAFQQRTYINGERILKAVLAKTKNPAYIDTLMMMYDQRIKYFGNDPKYGEAYLLGKKGADLYRYKNRDSVAVKQAYSYFVKSYEMAGPKTHTAVLQNLFHSAGDLMAFGSISQGVYVKLYMRLTDYLENAIKISKVPDNFREAKKTIDAMFLDAGITDCAILSEVLTQKYNSAPSDLDNLRAISSLLKRSECLDCELYTNVAEAIYKADPNADAAYGLAILFGKKQDFDKMESYLVEAIEKCDDPSTQSEYYVRLANVKHAKNDYVAVKKNCMAAIKGNPKNGEAYMLIGKAYAAYAPKYGEEDFDKKTVFWAAVDKFAKAKSVDPDLAAEADKLINLYRQHFPSVQEGFFNGLKEGDAYTIKGWINEKTTVRLIKQ